MLKIELVIELLENSRENQKYHQASLIQTISSAFRMDASTETIFTYISKELNAQLGKEIKNLNINIRVEE